MNESILNDNERHSSAVKKLLEHYTKRLHTFRLKNDTTPLESTERLRGKISEAKHILMILEGREIIMTESDDIGD